MPLWCQYFLQVIFSILHLWLLAVGIFNLSHPVGWVMMFFGCGGLVVIWSQIEWIGSEFDAASAIAMIREPKRQGSLKLPFRRILQVNILSKARNPYSLSTVELQTAEQTYTLVTHWELWKATDFAQRLAGVVGCKVLSPQQRTLPPIPISDRTVAKPPSMPMGAQLCQGLSILLIALSILGISTVVYWANQPLTRPAPLLGTSAITIDDSGTVYLFSSPLNRVQAYDLNGTFQNSIPLPTGKGRWHLCGGGNHPIELIKPGYSHYARLEQGVFVRQDQPGAFCATSLDHRFKTWQGINYRLKYWPTRLLIQHRDGASATLMVGGSWLPDLLANLPFVLGYIILSGGLLLLGEWLKR